MLINKPQNRAISETKAIFGPLRERIAAAVERVEGMLVSFLFPRFWAFVCCAVFFFFFSFFFLALADFFGRMRRLGMMGGGGLQKVLIRCVF